MTRPLGVRLAVVALCLLAVGAAVITGACALVARGYLMGQADQQLRAYAGRLTSHPFEVNPLGGLSPGTPVLGAGAFSIEVRRPGGQLVLRVGPGPRPARALPVTARAGQLVTVTGAGGGSWRVITEPIHYQARRILFAYSPQDFSLLVSSHGRAGVAGTLVVGADLAGVGQVVGRLVMTGLAVSGATILVAAFLGVLLIRATRRPVAQAEQASESGELRTLADTCRELRAPVGVIHGLARDHRRRGPLSAAEADRMMARLAGEARRIDALLAGLPSTPGEPADQGPAGE